MLEVQGLSVSVTGKTLLQDISFSSAAGFTAIVGPNGAGKSTLLRTLAGLIPCTKGTANWQGQSLLMLSARQRAGRMAWQQQEPRMHWPLSVRTLVRLARANLAEPVARRAAHVERALLKTGMMDFAERNMRTLSGGERARAWLAHILATDAPLLLMDEPVAALDPAWALSQLQLLQAEADTGKTVLCVLHDMQWVRAFADQVIVLQGGKLVAHNDPKTLLADNVMQEVFGVPFKLDGARVLPV